MLIVKNGLPAFDADRDDRAQLANELQPEATMHVSADENDGALDFTQLLRRFEIPLLQYATRITGDRERARDVVQETFVQLERNERAEVDRAPVKWLFTVCRNKALNVCRKERRMSFLQDDFLAVRADNEPRPNEQLEQKEARGFLLRIVETLPPRQQELLQLKFQNDLSYAEIAAITQMSVSNVGVTIHNALKTLRETHARAAAEFIALKPRTT